jgi:hypothetical protein
MLMQYIRNGLFPTTSTARDITLAVCLGAFLHHCHREGCDVPHVHDTSEPPRAGGIGCPDKIVHTAHTVSLIFSGSFGKTNGGPQTKAGFIAVMVKLGLFSSLNFQNAFWLADLLAR